MSWHWQVTRCEYAFLKSPMHGIHTQRRLENYSHSSQMVVRVLNPEHYAEDPWSTDRRKIYGFCWWDNEGFPNLIMIVNSWLPVYSYKHDQVWVWQLKTILQHETISVDYGGARWFNCWSRLSLSHQKDYATAIPILHILRHGHTYTGERLHREQDNSNGPIRLRLRTYTTISV